MRWISVMLWVAAVVITVSLAVFQRLTGPTHPRRVSVTAAQGESTARLPRSHGGAGGLEVKLPDLGPQVEATLQWRHFPTEEPWREVPMVPVARGGLGAEVPHQPPAGKVEYRIAVDRGEGQVEVVPADEPIVARFRGDVPAAVLIPHILAMFASMLLATRAMLHALRPDPSGASGLVVAAMLLLVVGGLILGPTVQKFAFDAFWTGWPFGTDLTDNKTAIAFLAWLPATVLALRRRWSRVAVLVGWVVMMGVFLIPHSLRGSQLDWEAEKTEPTVISWRSDGSGLDHREPNGSNPLPGGSRCDVSFRNTYLINETNPEKSESPSGSWEWTPVARARPERG